MGDKTEYRVLRNAEDMEAFEPAWRTLWQQDPKASPFQTPEWLLPWWHVFGTDDLRAVVIVANDAPIGLLPLYVYREPAKGERQMLLLGAGTSDYCDGLFAPNCELSQIRHALELACAEEGWDTFYASQLRPCSQLLHASEDWGLQVRRYESEASMRRPAVSISELPAKLRKNVNNARNRALRFGRLELTIADESDVADVFDVLIRLHTERWRGRHENGVLADARVQQWHREALPKLLRRGLLHLYALRLSGEIIAVLYSLADPPSREQRTQYFYLTGYSTGYTELSPGTLLLAMAIEQVWREGVVTIDFLRGDEPFKEHWHAETVPAFGFALQRSGAHAATGILSGAAA